MFGAGPSPAAGGASRFCAAPNRRRRGETARRMRMAMQERRRSRPARGPAIGACYVEAVTERDTTPEAEQAQQKALRRLGPEGRLRAALEMSQAAQDLAIAGLRRWHPEWDRDRARQELAGRTWGEALARRVWPGGR